MRSSTSCYCGISNSPHNFLPKAVTFVSNRILAKVALYSFFYQLLEIGLSVNTELFKCHTPTLSYSETLRVSRSQFYNMADALKAEGNKAFAAKNFDEAMQVALSA